MEDKTGINRGTEELCEVRHHSSAKLGEYKVSETKVCIPSPRELWVVFCGDPGRHWK